MNKKQFLLLLCLCIISGISLISFPPVGLISRDLPDVQAGLSGNEKIFSEAYLVPRVEVVDFKQKNMKPAYCLFQNVSISDPQKLEEYKEKVFSVVAKFNGEYVVAGENILRIEGDWDPKFLVMIAFPSMEDATKWYYSEEYKKLKELRHSSGEFNAIIMEGI